MLDAAVKAGVTITAPCGGEWVCGECRVRIESGPVEYVPRGCLSADELAQGWVLACASRLVGDLTIDVPQVETAGAARIVADGAPCRRAEEPGTGAQAAEPLAVKRLLQVDPPALDNSFSDLERFVRAVRHGDGPDTVMVGLGVLRKLAAALRAKDHLVTATIVPGDDSASARVAPVLADSV